MRAEEGDDGVTFYFSIFHGSIFKHITGCSSLILPEEDADLQCSLGGKKETLGSGSWASLLSASPHPLLQNHKARPTARQQWTGC